MKFLTDFEKYKFIFIKMKSSSQKLLYYAD